MRGVGCGVVLSFLSACSLIVTDPLPPGHQIQYGVMPACSQSNGAAGVDLLLGLFSAGGAAAAASDAGNPNLTPEEKEGAAPAAVILGSVAVLAAYSMVRGFQKSSSCRAAVDAAGFQSSGGNNWVLPPLILFTAAAAASSSGSPRPVDADLCPPGGIQTAICRDGLYSCSRYRAGTCSHHGGVSVWL
jgi:hypothetical protein